jgi:RNA polymerase sigma-70 factor (ECF subfamily)
VYLPVKAMTVNPVIAVHTTDHQRCKVGMNLHRKRSFMPKESHGFDAIGLEYLDGLYGYAMVLTRNHAEAEDLVQETYVRALPAMHRLRPESNVKSWLFRILRNAWLNHLRKRRTASEIAWSDAEGRSVGDIAEPSRNSYQVFVSKLEGEQVRAAVQALPAKFREIILLREFEELSYDEIASLLDCPVGTVMSRLARARSKLRVSLTGTKPESSVVKVRNEGLR